MDSTTSTTASGYPEAINGWLDSAPGNTFTWEIIRYDQAPGKFGKDVVIAILVDAEQKQHALWLSATVLVSEFANVKPEIGELVEVTYFGRRKGAVGGEYKSYKVTVPKHPGFVPDWDSMEGESAAIKQTATASPPESALSPLAGEMHRLEPKSAVSAARTGASGPGGGP